MSAYLILGADNEITCHVTRRVSDRYCHVPPLLRQCCLMQQTLMCDSSAAAAEPLCNQKEKSGLQRWQVVW